MWLESKPYSPSCTLLFYLSLSFFRSYSMACAGSCCFVLWVWVEHWHQHCDIGWSGLFAMNGVVLLVAVFRFVRAAVPRPAMKSWRRFSLSMRSGGGRRWRFFCSLSYQSCSRSHNISVMLEAVIRIDICFSFALLAFDHSEFLLDDVPGLMCQVFLLTGCHARRYLSLVYRHEPAVALACANRNVL